MIVCVWVSEREVTVMIKSINMILNVTQLDLLMKSPERHFTRSRLGKINEATHTFMSGYFQYKHCSLHLHVWLFIEWGAPSLLMSKHAKCLAWVQLSFVDKTESKTVLLPNYWSCSPMAKSCGKTRQFPSVLQSSESRALASFICFSNPFKVLEKLLVCVCFICAL